MSRYQIDCGLYGAMFKITRVADGATLVLQNDAAHKFRDALDNCHKVLNPDTLDGSTPDDICDLYACMLQAPAKTDVRPISDGEQMFLAASPLVLDYLERRAASGDSEAADPRELYLREIKMKPLLTACDRRQSVSD